VRSNWDLGHFRGVRLAESLAERMQCKNVDTLWVEGWRFQAFWQAVWTARKRGLQVWLRGESNDLKKDSLLKQAVKRPMLRRLFRSVDKFLCIGSANRRLYQWYGIDTNRCRTAPYCVDNDQFLEQANLLYDQRQAIRAKWRIPNDAFCVLFCGKFVDKKRPGDLIAAARSLMTSQPCLPLHLLFVGSGELENQLRAQCNVAFVPEGNANSASNIAGHPSASFVGFLNQSEVAKAYVAADLLVLPSDSRETWGLVCNEAMACGTPAVASHLCGCAEDLIAPLDPRLVFRSGDYQDLACSIAYAAQLPPTKTRVLNAVDSHHLRHTVATIVAMTQNPMVQCAQ
jgi:glycosyltransferase involved in cell wall biosynthesis